MMSLHTSIEPSPDSKRDESLGGTVAVIGVLLGVLAVASYPAVTIALLTGVTILWLSARTYRTVDSDTAIRSGSSIPGITTPRSRLSRRSNRYL